MHGAEQCNTELRNAVQFTAIHCSGVAQCGVAWRAVQCNATQRSAGHCNGTQRSAAQHSATQG
eukprot:7111731-Lingulodinium_polyedra.AAC.1